MVCLIPSLFAGGQGNTETSAQDNSTMSLFAQVDIQVSEKLNALLGVSYIEDEKEVSYNQINTAVFSNLDFVGAGTLGSDWSWISTSPGSCPC